MDDWYRLDEVAPGVTRIAEPFVHPYFSANMFHVAGRDLDLLVDAGMGLVPLAPVLPGRGHRPLVAVATHVHVDHVGALHEFALRAGPAAEAAHFATMPDEATFAHEFREIEAPVSRPPVPGWSAADYRVAGAPLARRLAEGDRIDLGDRAFTVLALPGHSPGCIGLLDEADGTFFAGDAIYDDELLDDLAGSDRDAYRRTMRRLIGERRIRFIHPGHGGSFDAARMREIARAYLERTGGE